MSEKSYEEHKRHRRFQDFVTGLAQVAVWIFVFIPAIAVAIVLIGYLLRTGWNLVE